MPRTENDKRTPYQKATGRRVTRALALVGQLRAELAVVEAALVSGRYVYHTSLAELATRLSTTMAELEALEEMNDDAEYVAALNKIPVPDLDTDQREFLAELALEGVHNASKSKERTRRIFLSLALLGLAREVVPEDSNAIFFEITPLGREIAGRL